jgi:spore cortex formation protein SpoVR/YcgB (stage V sporulation)
MNLEDWTEDSLNESWNIINKLATEKYGLTYYKPSFEIVNFEDMLHIYTGSFPVTYNHWSHGKRYEELYKQYQADRMGVAYEIVFNTSPALCYLLEHNSPTMQALVQAHASVGHSSFFRNNVLFKELTNAATILPFMQNAKKFISDCEETYGAEEVERLLDACHALQYYAFDRRPAKEKTRKEREAIRVRRANEKDSDYDIAVDTIKLEGQKESGKARE